MPLFTNVSKETPLLDGADPGLSGRSVSPCRRLTRRQRDHRLRREGDCRRT